MGASLHAPGEGPTKSVSVSVHEGTIEAVRARVGKRGVSGYIEAAIQRQIERDNLAELVADHETRHGVITEDEIAAAETRLGLDADPERWQVHLDNLLAALDLDSDHERRLGKRLRDLLSGYRAGASWRQAAGSGSGSHWVTRDEETAAGLAEAVGPTGVEIRQSQMQHTTYYTKGGL
ncbi:hypothetical protein GCM10010302_26400 [Streptomyces polychromogenes]|uniref:Ribbon-helix-helix protein CopG domain-containing protein n=1 Tax=Streptomyces polychromogenes TaxID=67342 RepID=A0ABP3EZG0_9ACTN